MTMARTDGDTWDIVTSVGYTALAVAAARALDAKLDPPLAHDEYAEKFVAAAGEPQLAQAVAAGDISGLAGANAGWVGVRTRFFDNFFADAAGAGVRQVVILAAGLDARAYRLPWPTGTTVFEVDQPRVLEFKDQVLAGADAGPAAGRVPVAVDLRDDWPNALVGAGFDPEQATAWALEGLLPYLPGVAQDALFEKLHELSAPGSRIAAELGPLPGEIAQFERDMPSHADSPGQPKVSELWYDDPRRDTTSWLAERGWTVAGIDLVEAAVGYGRPFGEIPRSFETLLRTKFFTATRTS